MILSKGRDLFVSQYSILSPVFVSVDNKFSYWKPAVVKALLEHPTRCRVSEELIYKVLALCTTQEDTECVGLLLQKYSVDFVTEDLLVAAAENLFVGSHLVELLLGHGFRYAIS